MTSLATIFYGIADSDLKSFEANSQLNNIKLLFIVWSLSK
uniref:Uncharacterized protein n=1 Tax=Lepeophtheirus salmonis TaxID=72036 RepID=A0A0K2T1Y1_LEPSM